MTKRGKKALSLWTRPSHRQLLYMVKSLVKHYGPDDFMILVDCEPHTLISWTVRDVAPRGPCRKAIWFAYSLTFRKEALSSMFHVMTWGKFARAEEARRIAPLVVLEPKHTTTGCGWDYEI